MCDLVTFEVVFEVAAMLRYILRCGLVAFEPPRCVVTSVRFVISESADSLRSSMKPCRVQECSLVTFEHAACRVRPRCSLIAFGSAVLSCPNLWPCCFQGSDLVVFVELVASEHEDSDHVAAGRVACRCQLSMWSCAGMRRYIADVKPTSVKVLLHSVKFMCLEVFEAP